MTEEGVREVKESLENGGHPCPHQSNDTFGGMKVPVAVTAVWRMKPDILYAWVLERLGLSEYLLDYKSDLMGT